MELKLMTEENEYTLEKETISSWDIYEDQFYKYETRKEHWMSKPSIETYTLRFTEGNETTVLLGCKIKHSIDGNRIEWYNDKHSGVIELK